MPSTSKVYKVHIHKAGYQTLCGRPAIDVETERYNGLRNRAITCLTCLEWERDLREGERAREGEVGADSDQDQDQDQTKKPGPGAGTGTR